MSGEDPSTKALVESLLAIGESLKPIFEFGTGLRAQLEADGWSPTAAETVALEAVQGLLRMVIKR